MAISIDCSTKVISIPRSDLTLLGGSNYQLDVDWFRLQLKAWEETPDGMSMQSTHINYTPVTLSGVTYARILAIINGYTVTFEDVGSPYTVFCTGANHNIADVKNVNQVSMVIGNSAGMVQVNTGGSGLSTDEHNALMGIPTTLAGTLKANVKQVNDRTIKGTGVPGDTWGPA